MASTNDSRTGEDRATGPANDVAADVDGDGCDDRLDWSSDSGRLTADTGSATLVWQLGSPGDELVLRDWNCDGAVTPGIHRPSTERTYAFGSWANGGAVTAEEVEDPPTC